LRTIIIDLLGTDRAPDPEIRGVEEFIKENRRTKIIAVGFPELEERIKNIERVEFVGVSEKVESSDKPAEVLKTKKNSSIAVGLRLLKEKRGDGFISAGNTGAVLAFSIKILGRLNGVKRPAICALFPSTHGYAAVLDVGANAESRPIFLYQFARMGEVFVKEILGIKDPKIALLSIGEEETKGNELIKKTREIFEEHNVKNFIGHIEGNEILKGKADVIVTDGFTGNVLLKFGEGVVERVGDFFKKEISKSFLYKIGALFMKGVFVDFRKEVSYEEIGGAPLLGINGNVFICHGRSNYIAIKNAIKTALRYIELNVNEKIRKVLSE
jgi:glycerol-3-phosphate acyltransferase PlsX